ncbi:hypothetical protein TELCIR_17974, partial [Teladorsagia circumcincta]
MNALVFLFIPDILAYFEIAGIHQKYATVLYAMYCVNGGEQKPVDALVPEPVAVMQNSRERVVPPDEVAFLSPVPPNYLTREQLVDLSIMAASQPEPAISPSVDK